MKRVLFACVAILLLASMAFAQIGSVTRIREFLEGKPTSNEIVRFYFWQQDWQQEDKLKVKGWLGEKMRVEEAIFVKIQPVFDEKGKKKKIKAKQLFPRMRKREEVDIEFAGGDALKVEARYANTGGQIQTGKTNFVKRFELPAEGKSVEVLCFRTSLHGQCRCEAEEVDAVPYFPESAEG